MNTIGEKVMMARTHLHLSQEDLALRIRKSLNSIKMVESGELIPDRETIFAAIERFGYSGC